MSGELDYFSMLYQYMGILCISMRAQYGSKQLPDHY